MIDKYDLKKINDQRFYSEKVKGFVEIKGKVFHLPDKKIDLDKVVVTDVETQELISDILCETKTKHRMEKKTSTTHSKSIFLLGNNSDGKNVWLEAPSWDCDWYWGFGYIKQPDSHSHFSSLVGKQDFYDHEKGCWGQSDYIHNPYDSQQLIETTFSYKEGWLLAELFKQFYLLREMADFTHKEKPGCHITTSPVDHGNMKDWNKQINEVMIPKITAEIMRILTPEKEVNNEKSTV